MTQTLLQGLALAPIAGAWLRGAVAMALAPRRRTAYDSNVPDKEGAGFDSLNTSKRTDRAMRFFYVRMPSCALYERRWRGGPRACWFPLVCQSVNPAIRRSPCLTAGRGVTTHTKEAIMPSCTTTPEKSPLSQTALNLLDELQKADRIIHVMLNAMTPAQKLKVHAQLDNEGVSGGGMIRHHERLTAMNNASVTLTAGLAHAAIAAKDMVTMAEMKTVLNLATDSASLAASYGNDRIHPIMEAMRQLILVDFDIRDYAKTIERFVLLRGLSEVGVDLVDQMVCAMQTFEDDVAAKRKQLMGGCHA